MSDDKTRRAIVFDGAKWHVRRIRLIEHDMERDEKVYRCDKPISSDHATLADVPEVASLLRQSEERADVWAKELGEAQVRIGTDARIITAAEERAEKAERWATGLDKLVSERVTEVLELAESLRLAEAQAAVCVAGLTGLRVALVNYGLETSSIVTKLDNIVYSMSPNASAMVKVVEAAKVLATQADGTLLATGYQRGSGNVVMVLEVSVNNACDLRDALQALSLPQGK